MDLVKMYLLLKMGISIAMLVHQRVALNCKDSQLKPQDLSGTSRGFWAQGVSSILNKMASCNNRRPRFV